MILLLAIQLRLGVCVSSSCDCGYGGYIMFIEFIHNHVVENCVQFAECAPNDVVDDY